MQSDKAIVLCFDHAHAFFACVVILSASLATESSDFNFALLCEGLEQADIDRLRALAARVDRPIALHHVARDFRPELTGFGRWPRASHFRSLAPDLVDAGTILYIDTDCLVHGDIADLLAEPFSGGVIGGVPDRAGLARERKDGRLGLGEDPYVNTGVLLIDAERWRMEGLADAYADCFRMNRDRIQWPNQDTLNLLLAGRKGLIDGKWNTMLHEHGPFGLEAKLSRSGIWHFTRFRPWEKWSDPWLRDEYLRFAKRIGLPDGYWVVPRVVSEWLMTAEAVALDGDTARANLMYKALLRGLVARDPSLLQRHIDQNGARPPRADSADITDGGS